LTDLVFRFAESTFSGQTSLELLQLSNNRMETITNNLFNELINLFRLALPNNRIELIEEGALAHCAQLRQEAGGALVTLLYPSEVNSNFRMF
jgi:hypothetical protein